MAEDAWIFFIHIFVLLNTLYMLFLSKLAPLIVLQFMIVFVAENEFGAIAVAH